MSANFHKEIKFRSSFYHALHFISQNYSFMCIYFEFRYSTSADPPSIFLLFFYNLVPVSKILSVVQRKR